jgi:hypothetical protein
MKVLTLNFLTCAVKTCKASSDSFPLHPKDAELVSDDVELNPQLLVNLLPRIDWNALRTTSTEASKVVSFLVRCCCLGGTCPVFVIFSYPSRGHLGFCRSAHIHGTLFIMDPYEDHLY